MERKGLSYVERWGKFFEVLLGEVGERVVILMDEIDSMLGLDFRADEFFAVIRECYSRRVDESQYERLTFALLGVCAPQDLIQDKRQTPFNIGRSIDLKGFQLEEAMPLRAGFVEKSKNLRAVLAAILDWTGGQPFLTQKLCHLVTQASDGIPFGKESDWVTALVKSQVLENWDTNDEQIHFRTMRDRLLNSAENSPLVLHIYQQILSYGEVVLNNNSEQQVLILSGLVIKRAGKLQVSNRIYKAIFNQDWITRRISELRPYRESLRNWLASDRKNTSYLLHGQSLEDALAWSEGKNLAPEDYQFISASQALAQTAHRPKVRKVLILSANPKDTATLRINEEVRKIQAELMRSRGRELFEIVMRSAVRPDDLQRILLDVNPQIVHFSGHGARVEGIALEDEMGELKVMSNQALGRLFRQFGCIECVVLNACYSEPQAEVLHRSVPYVLGISQAIGDRASQEFSLAFYDGLGAGRDYQEAYKLGLSVISNDAVAATPRLLIGGVDIEKEIFPFTYGAPVSADRFYGRKRAIAEMKNRIGAASPQCINLVGLRRSGKTSLLHYIRSRPNEFFTPDQKPLLVLLDLQDGRYHTPIGMNEGLRQGILDATGTSPWKEDENDDPYTIEDALIALRESGVRLIVMLDELEQIGQRLAVFRYWGDDWRSKASAELLTLVIATGRSIGEVYEQFSLTSPFANIFSKTVLGSLEPEVWRSLVREGLPRVTEQELEWVDAVSGGLPYYVQLAASMLFQYSDLAEAETEFWFQAEDRFGELWRDLNGPERSALKFAMGLGGVEPGRGLRDRMVRWGLLRSDGRLFSSAFGEWIRENGEAV